VHFYQLGRKLERADKTSRILDVKYFLLLPTAADVGTTADDIQWAAVLKSASAFEMYRKRYGRIAPARIVEFLLLDREFPRAIHHCLMAARESVHAISGTPNGMFRNAPERLLGALCSEMAYAQIDDLIASGLHEYLDELQTKMNQVGSGISETFFAARVAAPTAGKMRARGTPMPSLQPCRAACQLRRSPTRSCTRRSTSTPKRCRSHITSHASDRGCCPARSACGTT
jgi:uncharacterized alpha-E superfamily protein